MFTNPQTYQPYQKDVTMNFSQRRQPAMMSMSNMQMQSQYQNQQVISQGYTATNLRDAIRNPPINPEQEKPKMIWGKFTWILFHTMAEQIKEERFQQLRNEILHIIYTICSNLPCPMCAEHAKDYLAKNNLMRSQTKEELKYELFKFHNVVNERKNFPQFTVEQLNDMYSKAIPKVVIQNFLVQFNNKSKNIKLLADELHRQNISQTLKSWFQIHLSDFNDPSNPVKSSPIPSSPF
jgi:Erv1 / Alr family